ncbi:MAG: endolytic transglycosylase MltG [Rickettsiales bacterium]|nr:endolytic transglycosylase MltG [Rickettsiales bacterium]
MLSCAGFILLLGLTAYAVYYYQHPGPLPDEKILNIPAGTSFRSMTQIFETEGVVSHQRLYQLIVALQGKQTRFKAGEYRFSAGITPYDVTELLVKGRSITHSVTVPEGLISAEIGALLQAETALVGDLPLKFLEGAYLPETYFFLRGEAREAVLERMREAMDQALQAAWDSREADLPLRSAYEALTLASVVEKETGVSDERAHVASVFINRLRLGMPLQSDPTTLYGMYVETGKMVGRLSRDDLTMPSPYNTYHVNGLPLGPICNPGKATLSAVLHPLSTDDLYFVADGEGGHRFAHTLAEHNQNVARYRTFMRDHSKTRVVPPPVGQ